MFMLTVIVVVIGCIMDTRKHDCAPYTRFAYRRVDRQLFKMTSTDEEYIRDLALIISPSRMELCFLRFVVEEGLDVQVQVWSYSRAGLAVLESAAVCGLFQVGGCSMLESASLLAI